MNNEDIVGGVSPLKARQGSSYERRGYNVETSFRPDAPWRPPASSGDVSYTPKPYSYDADGNLVMNRPGNGKASTKSGTPEEGYWQEDETTTYKDIESYREVWDKNKDNLQSKYKDLKAFATAADEWWKKEAAKKGMSVEEFRNTYRKQKTVKGWIWVKTAEAQAANN
tara:strand:+ start:230 stop:733 length:504 start_codon:yes stop_codon:yes gene_type:complete